MQRLVTAFVTVMLMISPAIAAKSRGHKAHAKRSSSHSAAHWDPGYTYWNPFGLPRGNGRGPK